MVSCFILCVQYNYAISIRDPMTRIPVCSLCSPTVTELKHCTYIHTKCYKHIIIYLPATETLAVDYQGIPSKIP